MDSIATLEQKISRLVETKAKKAQIEKVKDELKKLYADNKMMAMQFEKNNYSCLLFLRSTHGYYKLFGHSALFYTYNVAPKLNLEVKLQSDGDYVAKSEDGFVSIRNFERVAERLRTMDIQKVRTKNQTGDFMVFKLPWVFTEDQLTDLIENNHFRMRNFNHVVMVDNIIPVLFIQLEELLKAIYENVRGMGGPIEREGFGYQLIEATTAMLHCYLDLANGLISKEDCFKQLRMKLNFIKYQVKLITDLKIWLPKTCARIGDIIIKIQEIIVRESRNG